MLEATQNVFMDRTATWSSIGKDASEAANVGEVLSLSGLDYTVEKRPVFVLMDDQMIKIPNRYLTCRSDNTKSYDVVSDKFEIVQNRDAFDFVNYMGDEISFEKAGETQNGMVYIIAKLPDVDILGDAFTPHVIFRNGFSGKVKITAAICPLRIVCQNQFNFAFKDTQNAVTIRHVQNAEAKLVEARETLKMSADYMAQLTKMAEGYAAMKVSGRAFERALDYMFPMAGVEDMNPYKRATLEKAREAFKIAHEQPDNANFKGTAWGLINAYTDMITHKMPQGKAETRDEGKFVTTTFGTNMNRILTVIGAVA